MTAILSVLYCLQAAFSGYNLYLASISISNLQEYEETSKKAAKYSNTAEKQLHKTRTTQASGTIAVLLSFLTSAYMIFSSPSVLPRLVIAVGNIAALLAAREHVGAFWKGKAKVPLPGVGDYNDAISITQETRLNMAYMAAGWTVLGALSMLI
ncbi:hypothetical protein D0Z07_8416 [Hyphodiscus hymeniophilus]|uniref:Uncharacterized protein n=1 Tax=Hyphodiscus hymeniophilus TaxID=353542 RepID=A0A9P6SLL1_9HELO|nr:hypothetical protein D0Z07_8416 [Hyphodiscus hymeniophilus]